MCSFVFISGPPPPPLEEKGRKYLDPMTQVILRLWGEVKVGPVKDSLPPPPT